MLGEKKENRRKGGKIGSGLGRFYKINIGLNQIIISSLVPTCRENRTKLLWNGMGNSYQHTIGCSTVNKLSWLQVWIFRNQLR